MTENRDPSNASGSGNDYESDDQGRHETSTLPLRRRPKWWMWTLGALLVAIVAGILFIPTSYTTYGPGGLWQTEAKIEVEGQKAFRSDGEIRYVTVSVKRASVFELVRAYFDDTIEIQDYEETYPTGDPTVQKVINQKQMDDAKLTALLVAFQELELPVEMTGTGAFVDNVAEDMASHGVLFQGDVITAIDGEEVVIKDDLIAVLEDRLVGEVVKVEVRDPDGEIRTEKIELGELEQAEFEDPDDDGNDEDVESGTEAGDESDNRGYLGVAVSTAGQDLSIPFEIDLDSGEVTGPSAGLAWTLGIIDKLSPLDLTDGESIAATGTISADGTVGTIGGIVQKMKAILKDDVDVFLYPAETKRSEIERITEMAADEVELVPVETVDDAIEHLLDGRELEPVQLS